MTFEANQRCAINYLIELKKSTKGYGANWLDLAINALEQQPSDDCISREEAIRVAEQGQIQGYEWQFKQLCDLPSVTPQQTRWIPVSERLPEEHKEVLTCSFGGFVEIQSFEDSYGGYWENQKGDWTDFDEVIAWMPLPTIYQGEENG